MCCVCVCVCVWVIQKWADIVCDVCLEREVERESDR